jgi:hypothetical protein
LSGVAGNEWLRDLLRDAAARHLNLLGNAAAKLDKFRTINSEVDARELGTFAHGVSDLAKQAGEARLQRVAFAASQAATAASDG